jgi:methanethiol S-methyltransferase
MRERTQPALAIAWGGALIFAASLLWFGYCYLVRFDRPQKPVSGGSIAWPILLDVLLFSGFALHHSVFARPGVKRWMERLVPARLERSSYTWFASIAFIAVCTWWQPVPGVVYRLDGIWRVLAYGVQFTGALLTIRASQAIGVLDLAGVRQVQRHAARAPDVMHLQTSGLYGFVRHPLYFAWALIVFGAPDMTATRALFACVSTAYLALAIPWEERALVHSLGREYETYREAVRWRMVPFIY